MKQVFLDELKIIPEEIVIHCAAQFGPDEQNSFKDSIEAAYLFRKVGLTPVYLCTDSFKEVIVTSKEKLLKQYN